jgi:hypothetical protein
LTIETSLASIISLAFLSVSDGSMAIVIVLPAKKIEIGNKNHEAQLKKFTSHPIITHFLAETCRRPAYLF